MGRRLVQILFIGPAQSGIVFNTSFDTESFMLQQNISSPTQYRNGLFFPVLLSWGAMLATLVVIAYACLLSPESVVQARIILQGVEVIFITWVAGILAGAVHSLGLAGEARHKTIREPVVPQALAA